jgi:hypothetical protein
MTEPTLAASLRRLHDIDLVARVEDLAASDRDTTAQLLGHLAELEVRGLHLQAGFGSLFTYCRDALCLSEHESFMRVEAARAGRRFPAVLEMLAQGLVNLTTVRLLAPHLTAENHRTVLESAQGKKKLEVEEIVARLAPVAEPPSWIRRLPAPRPALVSPPPATGVPGSATPSTPPPGTAQAPAPSTTPIAPERYRLQVTIGAETLAKLRLAKDMLGHAVPSGNEAEVLDRALSALLLDLAKKKFAATDRPRRGSGTAPGSRHIPAEVKRAVWLRDLGRCAFVGTGGRRCEDRRFLEFHHLKPYEVGGAATVDNIQLRCRAHNDYEARVYFDRGQGEDQPVSGPTRRLSSGTKDQEDEEHQCLLPARPAGRDGPAGCGTRDEP